MKEKYRQFYRSFHKGFQDRDPNVYSVLVDDRRIGQWREVFIDRKRLLGRLHLWAFFVIVGLGSSASEGREIEYEKINRLLSTVSQSKSPLIQSEIKLEILSEEISYDDVNVSM